MAFSSPFLQRLIKMLWSFDMQYWLVFTIKNDKHRLRFQNCRFFFNKSTITPLTSQFDITTNSIVVYLNLIYRHTLVL